MGNSNKPAGAAEKKSNSNLIYFILNNKALLILIILVVFAQIATKGLFINFSNGLSNLSSVARQVATPAILGLGFTVVLAGGGVDLSVGYMVSVIGVLYALLSLQMPVVFAILIAIVFGALLGMINGTLSVRFKLAPFILTLATGQLFKGVAYLLNNGKPVGNLGDGVKIIGQGLLFGAIPYSFLIMITLTVLMAVMMYRTRYGRHIIATGGNLEASSVSGINTKAIQISAYVVMGIFAAIGAIVLTGRTANASPAAGEGMEMDAIAAVVIGGTPMSGGKANIVGTIFGSFIMGIISNVLNLMNIGSFWQWCAKGVIIILAILLDVQSEKFFNKQRVKA
ncbi:ABC transporter permease [Ruminococcaceae bacterium OttesenSCG-928-D13]|nr:ABC transporter permease [Ruminococcaceae bacterium OttesenSCG-928-D13]